MKVVIPLAGAGKRLRPFTHTQPKPMIPVAGKPIVGHIVDELVEQGFDDYVFILGYLGSNIRHYIDSRYPQLKRTYVHQDERKGLGHAVWVAREAIADADRVLIVLGDLIFQHDLKDLAQSNKSQLVTALVDDPREFGVVEESSDGKVIRVVEKPRIPRSNKALVGIYKIDETGKLIEALDEIIQNEQKTQGEFQLTDALQKMIDDGIEFETSDVQQWFDCGRSEILLQTNALLLKNKTIESSAENDVDNSVIIPPVYIGSRCSIRDSIIGPFTTIGEGTIVNSSVVKNSIIGNESMLENVLLDDSVIGNDTTVRGFRQRLNIGDNTEIDLFQK